MPATAISSQQWMTAFIIAVIAHLLAAMLIWTYDSAPETPSHSPRGVMVSLDALSVGNTTEATTALEPVRPLPASPDTQTSTTTASDINTVKPVPAIPPSPSPVTPGSIQPTAVDTDIQTATETDIDIPVADTVTVKNEDTLKTIKKEIPLVHASRSTTHSANQGSGAHGLSSDPTLTYIARIRSWLGRHKYYPAGARRNGTQGTVRLYIVIARDGEVLNLAIARSSGSPILDQAAKEMVNRAQPLPAMPDDMLRTRLAIILPVHYSLSATSTR